MIARNAAGTNAMIVVAGAGGIVQNIVTKNARAVAMNPGATMHAVRRARNKAMSRVVMIVNAMNNAANNTPNGSANSRGGVANVRRSVPRNPLHPHRKALLAPRLQGSRPRRK